MSTSSPTLDPVAALASLNAETIVNRLEEIHAEDAALRVLLRSIRARERELARAAARRRSAGDRQEAQQ